MHANHREDMDAAFTGDIVAIVGSSTRRTGDTLADPAHPIVLESISFPTPVISVAVEPKTKADQDKLGTGLAKLADEDPTFVVKYDDETGQTVISGMGELHLDIIVDRLRREFSVDANVGKPQVAYRETIRKPVTKIEGRFIRQTGGHGQFGHVDLDLEPTGAGRRLRVHQQDRRRQDPARVHPGGRPGHPGGDGERRARRLPARGRPGHPGRTAPTTRSTRPRWRSRSPARWRSRRPRASADPVLLEPVMEFEVDHARGLHGRGHGRRDRAARADRAASTTRSGQKAIRALVPLAELFGYATDLRSRTQGRARAHTDAVRPYHEVPASISKEIVARVRGE